MQYILTQEEKNNLVPLVQLEAVKVALNEARKEILLASGYVCIHDENAGEYDLCDDCPCSSIGEGKDYKTWELICGLDKDYSQ